MPSDKKAASAPGQGRENKDAKEDEKRKIKGTPQDTAAQDKIINETEKDKGKRKVVSMNTTVWLTSPEEAVGDRKDVPGAAGNSGKTSSEKAASHVTVGEEQAPTASHARKTISASNRDKVLLRSDGELISQNEATVGCHSVSGHLARSEVKFSHIGKPSSQLTGDINSLEVISAAEGGPSPRPAGETLGDRQNVTPLDTVARGNNIEGSPLPALSPVEDNHRTKPGHELVAKKETRVTTMESDQVLVESLEGAVGGQEKDNMAMSAEPRAAMMPGAEELLTCAVCLDFLKEPKILPCHHSFCLACLENTLGRSYFLVCPKCRREVNITRRGLAELPNDFRTDEIKRTLIKMTMNVRQVAMCDGCHIDGKRTNARKYCLHCAINMCDDCAANHGQTESFRYHTVSDVGNSNGGNTEGICSSHGKGFKYYCMECDKVLCPICVMGACKQHQVKDLLGALESRRTETQVLLEILDVSLTKHTKLISIRNVNETEKYEQVARSVTRHAEYLISKINENKKRILDNVSVEKNAKQNKLEEEKRILQDRINIINQVKGQINLAKKPGMELHLLSSYKSLERMVELESNRSLPFPPELDSQQIVFVGNEELAMGDMKQALPRSQPVLQWHHQLPENCWGLCFLPLSGVAVTSGVFGSLWLLGRDGTLKHLIQESNKAGLFGLAYHDPSGSLIVTSPVSHSAKVVNIHTASIISEIKFSGVHEPTGIAIMSDGNFVVTDTYASTCGVSIHSPDGRKICSIEDKDGNAECSLFNCPSRVTVDCNDRIIVSDEGESSIKVFNKESDLLATIKQSEGITTRGICVDGECNIYIAAGNKVAKFSPAGDWKEDVLVMNREQAWKISDLAVDNGIGILAVLGNNDLSYYSTVEMS